MRPSTLLCRCFWGFLLLFLTCSKKFNKSFEGAKIFWCATSFHQYVFLSDKIWYQKTDSSYSYNQYYQFIAYSYMGMVCQNCFAHSLLVLIELLWCFLLCEGSNKTEHDTLGFEWLTSLPSHFVLLWSATYNCLSK